ncbi:MAG: sel1 repeat family protein, partial [Synergistaceae bacterium]|nr:sel1 repeat family protein [Synergistaceae bacterium]
MDAASDKEEKARYVLVKSKITYFALWFVPFCVSAFSDRMYPTASGRFIHFIGINSTTTAAVFVVLAAVIFAKSLYHKSLNTALWLLIFLDFLEVFIKSYADTSSLYGFVSSAIAGEEGTLYRAMFWSPVFALFKCTPSLSVLLWTERIFSKGIVQTFVPAVFGFIVGPNFFISAEDKEKNKLNSKNHRKLLAAIFVVLVFIIFMVTREGLGLWLAHRNDEAAERESLAKFYELGYSFVPDSEETKRAREMIKNGNIDGALRRLEAAESGGDSTADMALAEMSKDGITGKSERYYYQRGAERGNLAALSAFARTYQGKERGKLMELAAEHGDRHSYNTQLLGQYYMQGVFLKADYQKSAHYYKIAAEEGSIEGAWLSAGFLYRGYMSERDLGGAERWANEARQM